MLNKRILILALFGAVISAYLVYHHVNIVGGYNLGQSLCNVSTSFNCDDVAKSSYSNFFGLPVASFGLLYFLFATMASSSLNLIAASSILALIPSLLLLLASIFVIKKFCLFCLLLDLILISMLFLSFKYLKLKNLKSDFLSVLKPKFLFLFLLAGLFSFSLPSLLKTYVFEAVLDDSEIAKLYHSWNNAESVDLELDCSQDSCKGSSSAEVTIVEFSDFQCPFCQLAARQIGNLQKRFKSEVRIVYKHFPLDVKCNDRFKSAPHDLACQAAIFAKCAGEQFWQYHDALFELDYLDWKLEKLLDLSNKLGLDSNKINNCASDPKTLLRVKKDVNLGNKIGINSTPTIFVNSKKVNLERLDQLDKLVEKILKK